MKENFLLKAITKEYFCQYIECAFLHFSIFVERLD